MFMGGHKLNLMVWFFNEWNFWLQLLLLNETFFVVNNATRWPCQKWFAIECALSIDDKRHFTILCDQGSNLASLSRSSAFDCVYIVCGRIWKYNRKFVRLLHFIVLDTHYDSHRIHRVAIFVLKSFLAKHTCI